MRNGRPSGPNYGMWAFVAAIAVTLALGGYLNSHGGGTRRNRFFIEPPVQMLHAHLVNVGSSLTTLARRPNFADDRLLAAESDGVAEWAEIAVRPDNGGHVFHQRITAILADQDGRQRITVREWKGDDLFVFVDRQFEQRPKRLVLTLNNAGNVFARIDLPVDKLLLAERSR